MDTKGILAIRATLIMMSVLTAVSCSVISYEVKNQSEPVVPLTTLLQQEEEYKGKTVILGGYILETRQRGNETIIEVAQFPLTLGDEPRSEGKSEGKLIIQHEGALNSAAYIRNRKITVAGKLEGCTRGDEIICRITSREMHVWPEKSYEPHYNYNVPGYDPWDSPFPRNWYSR
jgi:outer membrane lipoprotein